MTGLTSWRYLRRSTHTGGGVRYDDDVVDFKPSRAVCNPARTESDCPVFNRGCSEIGQNDFRRIGREETRRGRHPNLNENGGKAEQVFLHSDAPERFAMEPAFEDLAKLEDIRTAKFAAKRLEYRAQASLSLKERHSRMKRSEYRSAFHNEKEKFHITHFARKGVIE